ncbi:MAG: hemolysin family protein [Spirochaetes bacterium]|nr:hemolysin family protein [Spirochaetota bacterium]
MNDGFIELLTYPFFIILLILIQAFFSNSEMAMVSSNRIRLNYLAKNGDKRAKIILNLLFSPERLFGTTLVGINIATVSATVICDRYFENIFVKYFPTIEHFISMSALTAIIMEVLILIFGELTPMSIARKYPNTTATRNAYFIQLGYILFFPLMISISFISRIIGMLFKSQESFGTLSRDELQLLVSRKFTKATVKTKKILEDLFAMKDLTAEDVMVHLNDVIAIEENAPVEELQKLLDETNYSRFPVYRDSILNIVATIHAINILGVDDKEPIKNYTEKLYIIPSTKPVLEILKELQTNRKYMGIVVDEFGAACGIISIENIVAEIVGEVNEEIQLDQIFNKSLPQIFDARTYLDDFYDLTGIDLQTEDAETLGGIINLAIGRIARQGEKVTYQKVTFEIIEASDRAVKKVKLLPSDNSV